MDSDRPSELGESSKFPWGSFIGLALMGVLAGLGLAFLTAYGQAQYAHHFFLMPATGGLALGASVALRARTSSNGQTLIRGVSLGAAIGLTIVWSYAYGANSRDGWRDNSTLLVNDLVLNSDSSDARGFTVRPFAPDASRVSLIASFPGESVRDVSNLFTDLATENGWAFQCKRELEARQALRRCELNSQGQYGEALIRPDGPFSSTLTLTFLHVQE